MSAKRAQVSKSGYLRPSTLAGQPLGDHDGLPITESSGTITGLAGGFSETAALDKIHVPVGSRVMALIVMVADSHEYDKRTSGTGADKVTLDEFVENTVYKGESVLLIDPDDVEELVAKHQQRIAEARSAAEAQAKAAKGQFQLPTPDAAAPGPSHLSVVESAPDPDEGYHDPDVEGEDAPNTNVPGHGPDEPF